MKTESHVYATVLYRFCDILTISSSSLYLKGTSIAANRLAISAECLMFPTLTELPSQQEKLLCSCEPESFRSIRLMIRLFVNFPSPHSFCVNFSSEPNHNNRSFLIFLWSLDYYYRDHTIATSKGRNHSILFVIGKNWENWCQVAIYLNLRLNMTKATFMMKKVNAFASAADRIHVMND